MHRDPTIDSKVLLANFTETVSKTGFQPDNLGRGDLRSRRGKTCCPARSRFSRGQTCPDKFSTDVSEALSPVGTSSSNAVGFYSSLIAREQRSTIARSRSFTRLPPFSFFFFLSLSLSLCLSASISTWKRTPSPLPVGQRKKQGR